MEAKTCEMSPVLKQRRMSRTDDYARCSAQIDCLTNEELAHYRNTRQLKSFVNSKPYNDKINQETCVDQKNLLSNNIDVRNNDVRIRHELKESFTWKSGSGAIMQDHEISKCLKKRQCSKNRDDVEFPWMEAFGGRPADRYTSRLNREPGGDLGLESHSSPSGDEGEASARLSIRRFYSVPEAELRVAKHIDAHLDTLGEKSSVNHDEIELKLQDDDVFDQPVKYRMRVNSLDKDKARKMQAQKLSFEQLYQAACSRK